MTKPISFNTFRQQRKEGYGDSITSPKMRALAKANAKPKKPVTLPKAPWEKGTNVTYDKNGRVVKEAAKALGKDAHIAGGNVMVHDEALEPNPHLSPFHAQPKKKPTPGGETSSQKMLRLLKKDKEAGKTETTIDELSAEDKRLMNKMYDKKGNQTAIGKKVMDHGAKKAGKKNIVQTPRTEAVIATMMVTRPGTNEPIKITATEWPSFKARGYHHAEQKENLNLINKIKNSGVVKTGSMSKDKDSGSDFQAGLDKVKADMKARQAARKANTDEAKKPVSQMTPAEKKADAARRKEYNDYQKSKRNESVQEAKLNEMHCEDCDCQYGNIDPECDCPNDGSDSMGEYWVKEPVGEALDMKQRLARGRSARKNKAKMAMGRKRAGRRIASMAVLKKRARRAARKTMTKRLTKGIAKADLSVSRKREIEKRLDKPAFKTKVNRLVKRTIKDIRKKEIARKRK